MFFDYYVIIIKKLTINQIYTLTLIVAMLAEFKLNLEIIYKFNLNFASYCV